MDDFYNDQRFSYRDYWQPRAYENSSEIFAINHWLSGKHFSTLVDLGGGYGRLIPQFLTIADHIILIEPSSKQRRLAKSYLPKDTRISILPGSDHASGLPSQSVDLVLLIRVIHHLSNTSALMTELNRILKPEGLVILEFANSLNFKSRIRSWLMGFPISKYPIDLRSPQNQNPQTIPFLNHHPQTILKSLRLCGFEPLELLSVSNFRSPILKKVIPLSLLLFLEKIAQPLFSSLYFGPSIFVLARKEPKLDKQETP